MLKLTDFSFPKILFLSLDKLVTYGDKIISSNMKYHFKYEISLQISIEFKPTYLLQMKQINSPEIENRAQKKISQKISRKMCIIAQEKIGSDRKFQIVDFASFTPNIRTKNWLQFKTSLSKKQIQIALKLQYTFYLIKKNWLHRQLILSHIAVKI